MLHGLSNEFLYSAKRIVTYWNTAKGLIESAGTGFFVNKADEIFLITNRHVAEFTYSHPEYAGAVFAIQRGFPTGKGINAPEGFYRKVMLVGINAGHFSDTQDHHSGISYFYKSSAILETIALCP